MQQQAPPATAICQAPEPLYFASAHCRLFGWLYLPAAEQAGVAGVVICKPFGFDSICGHRGLRAFAEASAQAGWPTLLFDYAGTGDSDDPGDGLDQIGLWVDDIVAAVAELKRRAGVRRVHLLGFRLGALLGRLASERSADVTGLLAIAPVVDGQRYLNELRTIEIAAARIAQERESASQGTPTPLARVARVSGDADFEVSGFLLPAATIRTLARIDLTAIGPARYTSLLVLDRADLPGAQAWANRHSDAGIKVRYVAMRGAVEMMMRNPDLSLVPWPMVEEVRGWLKGEVRAQDPGEAGPSRLRAGLAKSEARLPLGHGEGPSVIERAVEFGSAAGLFGIVAEPGQGEGLRRAVILLNSGGDYHIGVRRLHVYLARRWARCGLVVLRMDISGIGDSSTRPDQSPNLVFPPGAVEDIRAAVDFLRAHCHVGEVTVAGVCSGAYHALCAADAALPIQRIVMVNPLHFFQTAGMNDAEVQAWQSVNKPAEYIGRVLSASSWRRILRGEVNFRRIGKVYLQRARLTVQAAVRRGARLAHIRLDSDLRWKLDRIAARGISLVFVFSRGDVGLTLLEMHSGLSGEQLRSRYRLRMVEGADHDFTRMVARSVLQEVLSEEIHVGGPEPRL